LLQLHGSEVVAACFAATSVDRLHTTHDEAIQVERVDAQVFDGPPDGLREPVLRVRFVEAGARPVFVCGIHGHPAVGSSGKDVVTTERLGEVFGVDVVGPNVHGEA